jgi:hypothetical protein
VVQVNPLVQHGRYASSLTNVDIHMLHNVDIEDVILNHMTMSRFILQYKDGYHKVAVH